MSTKDLWLTAEEARAYIGCKTIKGWYEWKRRHRIVKLANGRINRADLDRALMPRKTAPKRGGGASRNPNSLANLTKHRKPFSAMTIDDALRETRNLLRRFARELSDDDFVQACEQMAKLATATAEEDR